MAELKIIKLGGSLYGKPHLKAWLMQLEKLSQQQHILIVPGGGPFAEQVRQSQKLYHFHDSIAHQMALLAMRQFGLMLLALLPQAFAYQHVLRGKTPKSRLTIWLPDDTLLNEPAIAHDWQVTSDSLSLWLAQQLNSKHLMLVKSCELDHGRIRQLSMQGILDPAFITFYQRQPVHCSVVNAQYSEDFLHQRWVLKL